MHDEIRGECLRLRPATVDDVPWLAQIAATPSVALWWGEQGEQVWRRRFVAEDQDAHRYVIEGGGSSIGFTQWYEEDDPEYRHAGMDLFLAQHAQGRGLGAEVVQLLARWLIDVRGHHRLVIDPAVANETRHPLLRARRRTSHRYRSAAGTHP